MFNEFDINVQQNRLICTGTRRELKPTKKSKYKLKHVCKKIETGNQEEQPPNNL